MNMYTLYGMSFRTREGGPEDTLLYLTRVCVRGLRGQLSRRNAVHNYVEDMLAICQTLTNGFSSITPMESGLKGAKNLLSSFPFGYFFLCHILKLLRSQL